MLKIGHSYTLEVIKHVEFGVFLNAENLGEVLLPNRYLPSDIELGDCLSVFLYLDSDNRIVATTLEPKV